MIPVIDCTENDEHEMWPQMPIGVLLLAFLKENERMAGLVDTSVQAVYQHALHISADVVRFCPNI